MDKKPKYSRKLALYLFKNNIKKKDFARIVGKHPERISNLLSGSIRNPNKATVEWLSFHTKGYITLEDCGY